MRGDDTPSLPVRPMLEPRLRLALLVALASSGLAAAQQPGGPSAQAPPEAPAADGATSAIVAPEPERMLAAWFGHVESDNLERTATSEDGSFESVGLLL